MRYIIIILILCCHVAVNGQRNKVHKIGDNTSEIVNDSLTVLRDSGNFEELRVGGKDNYITVDSANGIRFVGTTSQWTDIVFQAATLKTVGVNDKPDFIPANITLSFPEDTTEMVGIISQFPHSWKAGSTIYPHVHWRQTANVAVDWKISYKWWNIGDVEPANYTQVTLATPTKTYTSGTIHQLSTNAAGISGVGKTLSSILVIKLYRKSDSYTGEAELLQFDIHIELDKLGSNLEGSDP